MLLGMYRRKVGGLRFRVSHCESLLTVTHTVTHL